MQSRVAPGPEAALCLLSLPHPAPPSPVPRPAPAAVPRAVARPQILIHAAHTSQGPTDQDSRLGAGGWLGAWPQIHPPTQAPGTWSFLPGGAGLLHSLGLALTQAPATPGSCTCSHTGPGKRENAAAAKTVGSSSPAEPPRLLKGRGLAAGLPPLTLGRLLGSEPPSCCGSNAVSPQAPALKPSHPAPRARTRGCVRRRGLGEAARSRGWSPRTGLAPLLEGHVRTRQEGRRVHPSSRHPPGPISDPSPPSAVPLLPRPALGRLPAGTAGGAAEVAGGASGHWSSTKFAGRVSGLGHSRAGGGAPAGATGGQLPRCRDRRHRPCSAARWPRGHGAGLPPPGCTADSARPWPPLPHSPPCGDTALQPPRPLPPESPRAPRGSMRLRDFRTSRGLRKGVAAAGGGRSRPRRASGF